LNYFVIYEANHKLLYITKIRIKRTLFGGLKIKYGAHKKKESWWWLPKNDTYMAKVAM